METHFCLQCSHEQSYVGPNPSFIYCERCGSKIHADGSVSYDATQDAIEQQKEQVGEFDRRTRRNG